MSYHRAHESAPTGGTSPVTVCTNDVALCHLVEHGLPIAVLQPLRDAELFVPEVIELENDGIGLPAVHTRVVPEELDQQFNSSEDQSPLPGNRLFDVALPVRRVVLLLVRGPA